MELHRPPLRARLAPHAVEKPRGGSTAYGKAETRLEVSLSLEADTSEGFTTAPASAGLVPTNKFENKENF